MDEKEREPAESVPDHPLSGLLSDVERDVLDFAALRWRYVGTMETAVRERFDWSLTRYCQVLNNLLDRPEALEYAPQLVLRLRRLRDARSAQRGARRGFDSQD